MRWLRACNPCSTAPNSNASDTSPFWPECGCATSSRQASISDTISSQREVRPGEVTDSCSPRGPSINRGVRHVATGRSGVADAYEPGVGVDDGGGVGRATDSEAVELLLHPPVAPHDQAERAVGPARRPPHLDLDAALQHAAVEGDDDR